MSASLLKIRKVDSNMQSKMRIKISNLFAFYRSILKMHMKNKEYDCYFCSPAVSTKLSKEAT